MTDVKTKIQAEWLRAAVASLGIDRPVLRFEALNRGLRLYLYGGEVLEWHPPAASPSKAARGRAARQEGRA